MTRNAKAPNGPPPLNESLIACTLKFIEGEVKRGSGAYEQNVWADLHGVKDSTQSVDQAIRCGTRGCLAGWVCLLSTPVEEWREKFMGENDGYSFWSEAQDKLGLTNDEGSYLFDGWKGTKREQLAAIKHRLKVIRWGRETGKHFSLHPEHDGERS